MRNSELSFSFVLGLPRRVRIHEYDMSGDVIYLDYNATTPCDPGVVDAMLPFFTDHAANPSSRAHRPGQTAATAVEDARTTMARCLHAGSPGEVVFTAGATEANNLALRGAARALSRRGRHLVTQVTEHPAVIEPLRRLEREGWELTVVGVDAEGRVRPAQVLSVVRDDTVLVSLMLANNETGAVQPIAKIAAALRRSGVLLHCDAAQAVGKLAVDVRELEVDLLSFSAHKFYGPKGVGGLYLRRSRPPLQVEAQTIGGGQESGLRSGTVNVPGVVGMARALEIAVDGLAEETSRISGLRDRLERRLLEELEGVSVNGPIHHRLPGTSNLSFAGVEADTLLVSLPDLAFSTGSACTSTHSEPSPVLSAMGVSRDLAAASIRLGIGRFTTEAEVERAAERIIEEVRRLRALKRKGR